MLALEAFGNEGSPILFPGDGRDACLVVAGPFKALRHVLWSRCTGVGIELISPFIHS